MLKSRSFCPFLLAALSRKIFLSILELSRFQPFQLPMGRRPCIHANFIGDGPSPQLIFFETSMIYDKTRPTARGFRPPNDYLGVSTKNLRSAKCSVFLSTSASSTLNDDCPWIILCIEWCNGTFCGTNRRRIAVASGNL